MLQNGDWLTAAAVARLVRPALHIHVRTYGHARTHARTHARIIGAE